MLDLFKTLLYTESMKPTLVKLEYGYDWISDFHENFSWNNEKNGGRDMASSPVSEVVVSASYQTHVINAPTDQNKTFSDLFHDYLCQIFPSVFRGTMVYEAFITNSGSNFFPGEFIASLSTDQKTALVQIPVILDKATTAVDNGKFDREKFIFNNKSILKYSPNRLETLGTKHNFLPFFSICNEKKIENVSVLYVLERLGLGLLEHHNNVEYGDLFIEKIIQTYNKIAEVYAKNEDFQQFCRMFSVSSRERIYNTVRSKQFLGIFDQIFREGSLLLQWETFNNDHEKYNFINNLGTIFGAYNVLRYYSFVDAHYPHQRWKLFLNSERYREETKEPETAYFINTYEEEMLRALTDKNNRKDFISFIKGITESSSLIPYCAFDQNESFYDVLDFFVLIGDLCREFNCEFLNERD